MTELSICERRMTGHEPREEKREFHGLFVVQAWIKLGMVFAAQVVFGDSAGAAEAFGDVVASQFKVNAAQVGSAVFQDLIGAFEFLKDFERLRNPLGRRSL